MACIMVNDETVIRHGSLVARCWLAELEVVESNSGHGSCMLVGATHKKDGASVLVWMVPLYMNKDLSKHRKFSWWLKLEHSWCHISQNFSRKPLNGFNTLVIVEQSGCWLGTMQRQLCSTTFQVVKGWRGSAKQMPSKVLMSLRSTMEKKKKKITGRSMPWRMSDSKVAGLSRSQLGMQTLLKSVPKLKNIQTTHFPHMCSLLTCVMYSLVVGELSCRAWGPPFEPQYRQQIF